MKLDERLRQVAEYAAAGETVADIGADHAKLAIDLIKSGKISRAIAADINFGPCEAARRQIAAAGLANKIDVRQGDGLSVLEPGEVDTVCIAGMGGGLIASILTAAPSVVGKLENLVLQPMNDAFLVRKWLYDNAWHIDDESLAEAGGHIYAVMSARRGEKKRPEFWQMYVGEKICRQRSPLFRRYVADKCAKIERALQGMAQSDAAKSSTKFGEWRELKQKLEEMLN